jgi:mRNA-degrading endonuclease toxin of MazEF toxin-antitoxin module
MAGLPRRGELWLAALDPVVGREQGGRRPVLIVSTDPVNTGPSRLSWPCPSRRGAAV